MQTDVHSFSMTDNETNNLLRYSLHLARNGKVTGARTLLNALARQHPDDKRVWLWLARYAATPAEQQHALEQLLLLDPEHVVARKRLNRMHERLATLQEQAIIPQKPEVPKPTHIVKGYISTFAGIFLLIILFLIAGGTSMLSLSLIQGKTSSQSPLLFSPAEHATPTPTPHPTPRPTPTLLPNGMVIEHDGWYIRLISSTHTQVLTSTLGSLHAQGNFMVILLAIGNTASEPRYLPENMVTLIRSTGEIHTIVTDASRIYLDIYGRGTHGDLACEDLIPGGGGLYSIPFIFDIPSDTQNVLLTTGKSDTTGWLISTTPSDT